MCVCVCVCVCVYIYIYESPCYIAEINIINQIHFNKIKKKKKHVQKSVLWWKKMELTNMHEEAAHMRIPLKTLGYFRSFWALTFSILRPEKKGKAVTALVGWWQSWWQRTSQVSWIKSWGSRAGGNRLTATCQSMWQGCQDWMAGIGQNVLLITSGWTTGAQVQALHLEACSWKTNPRGSDAVLPGGAWQP